MSEHRKLVYLNLVDLESHYVEFSKTPGILRCLRKGEDTRRARGLVFNCPKCEGTDKPHQVIFLFALMGTADEVRPHGRFVPNFLVSPEIHTALPPLNELTLHESPETGHNHALLRPRDTQCGWNGYVIDGEVSWRHGGLAAV